MVKFAAANELVGSERINGLVTENCVHPFSSRYAKIRSPPTLFARVSEADKRALMCALVTLSNGLSQRISELSA